MGGSRRIVAEDDAPKEVLEIKAEPARMAALPRRTARSTHLEVKDDPPSPCGSASGSSFKTGSSNNSTSGSSDSSSKSTESKDRVQMSPVHYKGALKAAKTGAPEKGEERAKPLFLVETRGRSQASSTLACQGRGRSQDPHNMCDPSKSSTPFSAMSTPSRWEFSSSNTRIAASSRSRQLRLKVHVCIAFGVMCMQSLHLSLGSVGRVPREEFVAHVVSAFVPGDLRVVWRVFCVMHCVKIWALRPRWCAAPSPGNSKLCYPVERRTAFRPRRQWGLYPTAR